VIEANFSSTAEIATAVLLGLAILVAMLA